MPLKLLLVGVSLVAIIAVLLLGWLVNASTLPEWIKFVVSVLLASFIVVGGTAARRRYRDHT